jgi:hypothetical protein
MANRPIWPLWIAAVGLASALAYVLLLRGAIELLHPKFGAVTRLADALGFGEWWVLHLGAPGYDLLTGIGWDTALIAATAVGIAVALLFARRGLTRR